ncbi:RTA1 like protein-domain-containing protein [Armillaria novae-zelandiae]|uniref:RTA1 like protein-domain-containing protein n=1 Tax=Armillaria novae-zelandiae TaxID=153914 RepID=A0AA39PYH9_9AGAR|nr:RTA1 like protein-domain-containing protein [Armillaria novae-zelandiae]
MAFTKRIAASMNLAATTILYMARDTAGNDNSSQVPTRTEIVYGEIPSKVPAAIVGIVYVLIAFVLFFRICQYRNWWGFCLPIGAVVSGVGFFIKIVLVSSVEHQNSKGLLATQNVLIACAPAAFLAFNYIVYGRLVVQCLGARFCILAPTRVSMIFICSDIVTFIVQAGGAALIINPDRATLGKNIFLAGLILQSISYYIFTLMMLWTHWKLKKARVTTGGEYWWKAVWLLYVSSFLIIIRTIYRLVEGASDRGSYVRTHEVFFYCLDSLPLLLSIGVYMPFWPGKYITKDSIVAGEQYKLTEGSSI